MNKFVIYAGKNGDMARNARVGNMAKMERTCQSLANILMRQQKQSNHFGEKGIFGEHAPKSYQNFK